jgi:hypothetical protein
MLNVGASSEKPTASAHTSEPPPPSVTSDALPIHGADSKIIPSYLEPGSVRTPPGRRGNLFDDSPSTQLPPVEQYNLPRYRSESGVPEHIKALDNPETLQRADQFVRVGVERGGHRAFDLEPLRQYFYSQLGPQKGQAAFDQIGNLMGAVSSVSPDLATLRNATYFDHLIKQGTPLPTSSWDPITRRLVPSQPLPYPYGHLKQGLHVKKVNEVVANGRLNPLTAPKLASVAEQFRGNQIPVPLDRHVLRALGATDARGQPIDRLTPSGYEFVEGLVQRQAPGMDLTPGQYQGALRAGAAELTGLRSPRTILETLRDRVRIAAGRDGISEWEVLRRLAEHGYRLPVIGAVAGAGAASTGGDYGMPEEQ